MQQHKSDPWVKVEEKAKEVKTHGDDELGPINSIFGWTPDTPLSDDGLFDEVQAMFQLMSLKPITNREAFIKMQNERDKLRNILSVFNCIQTSLTRPIWIRFSKLKCGSCGVAYGYTRSVRNGPLRCCVYCKQCIELWFRSLSRQQWSETFVKVKQNNWWHRYAPQ